MSKWSKAAKLVSGVRDGLARLDGDERRRAIEALRSIVYEDMFGAGSQELPADACVRCGSISIVRKGHTGSGNQRWYCKDFMHGFKGVSTKHLQSYLAWFQWTEAFKSGPTEQRGVIGRQIRNGVYRLTRSMYVRMPMPV